MDNTEYPKGWFDITDAQYSDFGAMSYLYAISAQNQSTSMAEFLRKYEAPFRAKQYRIFRQNGFARAFLTYAMLNREHEYELAVNGVLNGDGGWNSGRSMWIVDIVSPFGQAELIRKHLENTKIIIDDQLVKRIRALRPLQNGKGKHRIVQWQRYGDEKVKFRQFSIAQFKTKFEQVAQ